MTCLYVHCPGLKSIVSEGKNIVDISFSSEDPFQLDSVAIEKNVTAVVDCGISPGLSNLVLGYHNKKMEIIDYKCMIGGLPFKKELPFMYKAYFSPIDVIEEYIRPARIVEDGTLVTKDAMTDLEIIEFENIGKLEAVNTDGLRTLLKTMKIPNMVEKTLRYPGHIELMKVFKEIGLFSSEEIDIGGRSIKPVALTSKLVFPFGLPKKMKKILPYCSFRFAAKLMGKMLSTFIQFSIDLILKHIQAQWQELPAIPVAR